LEYWRGVLRSSGCPAEWDYRDSDDLHARIRSDDLGAVRINDYAGPAGVAWTTRQILKRSGPDWLTVVVTRHGHMTVDHAGRQSLQHPGDFVILDNSRLFRSTQTAMAHVAVNFPRQLLPAFSRQIEDVAGIAFNGSDRASALFSSFAQRLPGVVAGLAPAARARLGTTLLDLLTVALTDRLDMPGQGADARERTRLAPIRAFVEERLGDPDLSPASIAAAHHVSVRYLHRLFQAEGTTVSSWIRHRRLERCRHELLDPSYPDRPVAAIAARWGFSHAAHFSRVFRAAYGIPPGEYRATFNAAAR
jgi:AraC-like DNA-binding protein